VKIVRIGRVGSANHQTLMIYIPKAIKEVLGLRKGMYVKLTAEGKRLLIEPLELDETEASSIKPVDIK
jgi:bifunctional DNA-binding transcriptional regulator/antitoxin component of YhaV-PrlF toxin-antitoxin module